MVISRGRKGFLVCSIRKCIGEKNKRASFRGGNAQRGGSSHLKIKLPYILRLCRESSGTVQSLLVQTPTSSVFNPDFSLRVSGVSRTHLPFRTLESYRGCGSADGWYYVGSTRSHVSNCCCNVCTKHDTGGKYVNKTLESINPTVDGSIHSSEIGIG